VGHFSVEIPGQFCVEINKRARYWAALLPEVDVATS
jgi:hypothetical protein